MSQRCHEHPANRRRRLRAIAPDLLKSDGTWYADYVRLRFAADRPGG